MEGNSRFLEKVSKIGIIKFGTPTTLKNFILFPKIFSILFFNKQKLWKVLDF